MNQPRVIFLLVFSILMTSAVALSQSKTMKASDEQALIALDKQWTAAELPLNDEDRKTIDGIVAADYTGTSPFGQLENKAQYMAGLKHSEDQDVADGDYQPFEMERS